MLSFKQIEARERSYQEGAQNAEVPVIRSDLPAVGMPCCGVFACALLRPHEIFPGFWDTFRQAREHLGRSRNWAGRMETPELMKLLDLFGIHAAMLEGFKGGTFARAVLELKFEAVYLVEVTGHYCVLHRGLFYDQGFPQGIDVGRCTKRLNQRVQNVWKIRL